MSNLTSGPVAMALTDEEFKRGFRDLAAESVMEASDADLKAWLAARTAARQGKATLRKQT